MCLFSVHNSGACVCLWLSDKHNIGRFLMHSDTEYRPIESPVSHLFRIEINSEWGCSVAVH